MTFTLREIPSLRMSDYGGNYIIWFDWLEKTRQDRSTGDELQGTMGRVQTAGDASSCPMSPSRLPLRARERRLGTRQTQW